MSGYKVVPMEPTAEMIEAAQDAYMPFGDMDIALRMAALAAPAVQGEPVAYALFASNGSIRIWCADPVQVETLRQQYGEALQPLYTTPQPAPSSPTPTFQIGDHVRKTKGSQWKGRVVGTYSTSLTPEGYAVESDTEKGSVQIYPVGALELVGEDAESDVDVLVEALEAVVSYHMEVKPNDVNLMMHYSEMLSKVRAALAAHRKGGDV